MNKKLLFIAAVVMVAIAGGVSFLLLREKPAPVPIMNADKTNPQPEPVQSPAQDTPGSYVVYSPEAVAAAKGTKFLFFYASWCPQCRQLDREITAGPLPNNIAVFKVDYDSNQSLRQKYGVQLQTTFVKIDDSGNLLQKFVAYDNPTLASLIEHLF